jgi:hypothetical protein
MVISLSNDRIPVCASGKDTPAVPWHEAVALVAAVFLAFGFVHSACVTSAVKGLVARLLGERLVRGWYRFLYNAFGFLTTALAVYLIVLIPDARLWTAPLALRIPMHALQLLGAYVGLRAFDIFDTAEFMGLRQALAYVRGRHIEGDIEGIRINRLVTTGIYGLTRNPMYLGGILLFTFNPYVTRNWLTVSALADLYFIMGAFVEERRLLSRFGEEYDRYKKRVPLLLPRPRDVLRHLKGGGRKAGG